MEAGTKTKMCHDAEDVLSMTPSNARDFLLKLQKNGELESYLRETLKNRSLIAFFSYWEKWFPEDIRRLIDENVRLWKKADGIDDEGVLPLRLDEIFSSSELRAIFENTKAIQLTFGCSQNCPRCGFDAACGVRDIFPFPQLKILYKRHGDSLGRAKPIQYWASEPTDYRWGNRSYYDAYQLAVEYAGYRPHITSRNTNDEAWLKFLDDQCRLLKNGTPRVSAFQLTDKEFRAIEDFLGKESKVVILGRDGPHYRYLGISAEQNLRGWLDLAGIGCFNSMLLTPRGLYNLVQVPVSLEFPQGQIVVPFEKFGTDEITVGSSLKAVLRNAIVLQRWNHRTKPLTHAFQRFVGRLPQKIHLLNKAGVFRVLHDRNGVVVGVERVRREICERARRIRKNG
jgi:hypothetical protein